MNAPIPSAETAFPDAAGASPVMAQFFDAKARQPDALVFFRMGDFYEMFFEDAVKAAAALGIALTHRGTHAGAADPDGRGAGARGRGLSRQADPRRLQGRRLRADGGPGRGAQARRASRWSGATSCGW